MALDANNVHALAAAFRAPRFFLNEDAVAEAIRTGGMFNVTNVAEGDKIDFWLLTADALDRSRFSRRIQETVFGSRLHVSSPEDTILAKLRWSRQSGNTTKPYVDALHVFEVQAHHLDIPYINNWSERLCVADLWTRLQAEADLPA